MDNNPQLIRVETQNSLEEFLLLVDYFHDALIKKIILETNSYVAENGIMYDEGAPYRACFLVQSQSEDIGSFEVVFEGIDSLTITLGFPLVPSGAASQNQILFSLSQEPRKEAFMVVARQMGYRMLGASRLGKQEFRASVD